MLPETLLICLGALLASAALTGGVRSFALSRRILDVPNARSSHQVATPRGGGLAVVAVTTAAIATFSALGMPGRTLYLALVVGGLAVALVGWLDDRYSLPPGVRLTVHVCAALWAVYCVGGLPPLRVGDHLFSLGWSGDVLAVVAIVWALNLFNFMDGIDGIAASEAVFVACGGALLGLSTGDAPHIRATTLAFGAACCGFLVWNWPPARIFMGDVGSGYLGFVLSVLALAAAHDNSVALWVWLTLGGVFVVDTTVTLLRRVVRRERLQDAHRTHAYQWLARRWRSHRRVTLAVIAIDVLWLLPCATFAAVRPSHAGMATVVALTPLAVIALVAGSGRK